MSFVETGTLVTDGIHNLLIKIKLGQNHSDQMSIQLDNNNSEAEKRGEAQQLVLPFPCVWEVITAH